MMPVKCLLFDITLLRIMLAAETGKPESSVACQHKILFLTYVKSIWQQGAGKGSCALHSHSGIQADIGSVISDSGFQGHSGGHSGQHSEANGEREVVGDQMMSFYGPGLEAADPFLSTIYWLSPVVWLPLPTTESAGNVD